MRNLIAVITAIGIAWGDITPPVRAEIIRSEAALAGKNFCWSSGSDSEQYGRDHSYVYSYRMTFNIQIVLHGSWTMGRDGAVTLKIDGGMTFLRRYDINDDHVTELTGSLMGSAFGGATGSGADGHVC